MAISMTVLRNYLSYNKQVNYEIKITRSIRLYEQPHTTRIQVKHSCGSPSQDPGPTSANRSLDNACSNR